MRQPFLIGGSCGTDPGNCLAQSPPTPKAPVAPKAEQLDASRACAPGGADATVGQGGDGVQRKPDDKTLSDKLASSKGVICPPTHVDPEIKAPTPPGGRHAGHSAAGQPGRRSERFAEIAHPPEGDWGRLQLPAVTGLCRACLTGAA